MPEPKKVIAVLDDLFFTVKIMDAAKRAGLTLVVVKSETDAMIRAKEQPELIILDLNCNAVDTMKLIAQLKADESTRGVDLVGYVSHVQGDVKQAAQEAGCNMVLARSAFSQNLPQIMKRHA